MTCVITPKASSVGAFAINFIVYLLMRTLFNHIFSHIVFLSGTSLKESISPWSQQTVCTDSLI